MNQFNSKNWKVLLSVMGLFAMLILFSQCKSDDEAPPTTDEAPTSSFDVGTINGLEVSFVNASLNADSYAWDFGDGNTSTDQNPTHTYAAGGTYTVSLTATNTVGDNTSSKDVTVMEADVIANFIKNKEWRLIREEHLAYMLGPQSDTWSWNNFDLGALWFSYGDLDGAPAALATRASLANDVYTFNDDGTYNVDFMGDFWGEYGMWQGTPFNEVDIDISGGSLPPNANGVDVSALIAGSWEYAIDEVNMTLDVIGDGAHMFNPRYKNVNSSYEAGTGIQYQIAYMAEGATADTLVLRLDTHDNDFDSDPKKLLDNGFLQRGCS